MPHSDEIRLGVQAGGAVQRAGQIGLLTDAGVTAADTLNGLDAFVNGVAVHSDQYNYKPRVKLSWRVYSGFSDAAVLNLTTVAGLAALTPVPNVNTLSLLPND